MVVPIRRGEPTYEWLREQAQKRLSDKFPDLKTVIESGSEESEYVVAEFVAVALGTYSIPIRLDLYNDGDQYRMLKEKGFRAFQFPERDMTEENWLYYRRMLEKDYKRAKNLLIWGLDVETDNWNELGRLQDEKRTTSKT